MPARDSYKDAPDDLILSRYLASRDSELLGILLDRYTLLLLGVAMKYLQDRDAAQDAVQYVFLKALSKFPEGPVTNFKGWLYTVIKNYCLQELSSRRYHSGDETALLHAAGPEPENPLPYSDQQLKAALETLPGLQRQCVELFYLHGKSYQEIEALTGQDYRKVKSCIQNGKRNLRLTLEKLPRTES